MTNRVRIDRGGLAVGLLLFACLSGLALIRGAPPAPLDVDARLDRFSAKRAWKALESFIGDGSPRPAGSEANRRAVDWLVGEFERLGYRTTVQSTRSSHGRDGDEVELRNVIAWPPGVELRDVVLVVAHHDSVRAGPGVADDGAGVAALVEIARALGREAPTRNPVAFLVTDGEESGLQGARAFVDDRSLVDPVWALVNLDARGTSGLSLLYQTSHPDRGLVELYGRSVPRPATSSLFDMVYSRLPNDSDFTILRDAGFVGLNFAFIGDAQRYHTALDDLEHLDPGTLQHLGESALAVTRALAAADPGATPRGDQVYFDLLGVTVLGWPSGWSVAIAVAILVVLGLVVCLRLRNGALRLTSVLRGMAVALVSVAGSVAVGFVMLYGLRLLGLGNEAWPEWGAALQAVFWLVGVGVSILVMGLQSASVEAWGAWAGHWLLMATAGTLVAVLGPGACYLFLAPAAVAGLVGLLDYRGRRGVVASGLATAASLSLWLPVALLIYQGLGVSWLPLVAGMIAIGFGGLQPIIVAFPGAGSVTSSGSGNTMRNVEPVPGTLSASRR